MKTIKFVGYLFHRYYSKGKYVNSPYFDTVCAMAFLAFIHLFQILIAFDAMDLIPIKSWDNELNKIGVLFLTLLPLYFLMTWLFKKSDIEPLKDKYDYDWDKVFAGNVWLLVYMCCSFILLIVIMVMKTGN